MVKSTVSGRNSNRVVRGFRVDESAVRFTPEICFLFEGVKLAKIPQRISICVAPEWVE